MQPDVGIVLILDHVALSMILYTISLEKRADGEALHHSVVHICHKQESFRIGPLELVLTDRTLLDPL